ncbi:hypothetical protein HOA92_02240 [archaeon]|nr:hypothetical protein [archaeon]MBT6761834.1 hypothetical protein [archaeon]
MDIHSTTGKTDDFVITVGDSELSKYFPIEAVVDMHAFARGVSLIENVKCGISLEYSNTSSAGKVSAQVRQFFVNMGLLQGSSRLISQKKYSVYGMLKKSDCEEEVSLENFVETTFQGEKFVPILAGEEAYGEILCLKARRVE